MEVAHEHLAFSCSTLGVVSRSLLSKQLLLLLKVSMRPLIQINAMPGWFEEPEQCRQIIDLPENRSKWVILTMTPVAEKGRLATEKPNSLTRLLAATVTYKIMKRFREGMTQHEIQEEYQVRPKQLALCLTG